MCWIEGRKLRFGSLSCHYLAVALRARCAHGGSGGADTASGPVAFLWTLDWTFRVLRFSLQWCWHCAAAPPVSEDGWDGDWELCPLTQALYRISFFWCLSHVTEISLQVVTISVFPIMFPFLSWLQRSSELNLLLDYSCWVGQGFKYIFLLFYVIFFLILIILFLCSLLHITLSHFEK